MGTEQGNAKIAALAACFCINALFSGLKITIPTEQYAQFTGSDLPCAGNTRGRKVSRLTIPAGIILWMMLHQKNYLAVKGNSKIS